MSHRVVTATVTPPAAGADVLFVPSQTDTVLLLAVTAKLTSSAAVANRRAALAFKDESAGYWWSADAVYPQVASLGVTYSWARGAGAGPDPTIVAAERIGLPLPWARLQPNDSVGTLTALIDVADQWSAIVWRGIVGDFWEDEQELAHLARAFTLAAAG